MEDFDYTDQTKSARKISPTLWNCLTVVTLLTVICVVGVFFMIFINPSSGLNPFPPATLPVAIALPTITPTPRQVLPPTWTPTVTSIPTQTNTPRPTSTLPPTATPFTIINPTVTPTTTQSSEGMSFAVGLGSPVAISSLPFHPDEGCNWMGVAGQVLDMSGAPVSTGVQIWLGGVLGGTFRETPSLTGTARQYGEAGYEIYLADHTITSRGTLWVQLLDQAGLAMSEKVFFDTYDDCEKNLIFINFKQVR